MSPHAHLSLSLHPPPSLGDKDGSVFQCRSVVPPWACPEPVPSEMAQRCVCVCVFLGLHCDAHTCNFHCVKGCSGVLLARFHHLLQSMTAPSVAVSDTYGTSHAGNVVSSRVSMNMFLKA